MAAKTVPVSTDELARALAAIEYAEEELRRARTLIRELFTPQGLPVTAEGNDGN